MWTSLCPLRGSWSLSSLFTPAWRDLPDLGSCHQSQWESPSRWWRTRTWLLSLSPTLVKKISNPPFSRILRSKKVWPPSSCGACSWWSSSATSHSSSSPAKLPYSQSYNNASLRKARANKSAQMNKKRSTLESKHKPWTSPSRNMDKEITRLRAALLTIRSASLTWANLIWEWMMRSLRIRSLSGHTTSPVSYISHWSPWQLFSSTTWHWSLALSQGSQSALLCLSYPPFSTSLLASKKIGNTRLIKTLYRQRVAQAFPWSSPRLSLAVVLSLKSVSASISRWAWSILEFQTTSTLPKWSDERLIDTATLTKKNLQF